MDAVVFLRDVPLEPVSVDLVPHLIHILRLAGHRVRWLPDPGCLFVDSPLEGRTIAGKVCGEENGMAAQTLAELFRWVRMAGGVALSTPTHRTDVQIRILTEPCDKGDHPSILIISGRRRWFSPKRTLADMVADSLRGAVDLPVGIVTERSAKSTEVQIHLKALVDDQIPQAAARAIWSALMTRYSTGGSQISPAAVLQALGRMDILPLRASPDPVQPENAPSIEKIEDGERPVTKVASAPAPPTEDSAVPASREEPSPVEESGPPQPSRKPGRVRPRQLPESSLGWRPRVVWESEGPDPFPYTVEGTVSGPGVNSTPMHGWFPDLAGPGVLSEPVLPPPAKAAEATEIAAPSGAAAPAAGDAPAAADAPDAVNPPVAAAAPAKAAAPTEIAVPTGASAPATADAPAAVNPPAAAAAPVKAAAPTEIAVPPGASAPPTADAPAAVNVPAVSAAPVEAAAPAEATAPSSVSALAAAAVRAGTTTPAAVPAPALVANAPAAAAAPADGPAQLAAAAMIAGPTAPAKASAAATAETPAKAAAPARATGRTRTAARTRVAASSVTAASDVGVQPQPPFGAEHPSESKSAHSTGGSTSVAVAIESQTYRFTTTSHPAGKTIQH